MQHTSIAICLQPLWIALGEPTTQLTLKSKSDARAAKADVTQGLPRVEELLEARNPKAQALLADIDGTVQIIDDKKSILIRIVSDKKLSKNYEIPAEYEVITKDRATVKEDEVIAKKGKKELKAEIDLLKGQK